MVCVQRVGMALGSILRMDDCSVSTPAGSVPTDRETESSLVYTWSVCITCATSSGEGNIHGQNGSGSLETG